MASHNWMVNSSSGSAPGTMATLERLGSFGAAHRAQGWLAWAVWLLTLVAVSSVGPTLRGASPLEVAQGIASMTGVLTVVTIGTLVVSKRREQLQGWLLVMFSFLWSLGLYAYHFLRLPGADPSSDLVTAHRLIAIGDSAFTLAIHALLLLMLLVPDGRLPTARWRPMLWFMGLSAMFWVWFAIRVAPLVEDVDAWLARSTWVSNDGSIQRAAENAILAVGASSGVVMVFLLARALWVRIRAAQGEERQQIKWVCYGNSAVLAWLLVWLPQPDGGWLAAAQYLFPGLAFVWLGVGFGMALFRYRLWDIDLVVRRSLVYGVLWAAIAAVYAGVAAGLGLVAGARFPVGAAIGLTVLATLVFQPARRWLERLADRWVFGRRESAVEVFRSFGAGMAASRRPRDVASGLAVIAHNALGLKWVEVDIDGSPPTVAGTLADSGEDVIIPIVWNEESFGSLSCRPQRGVDLTDDDIGLLTALAGQAALAISHARLASRIVHAQETERRRIERNIHDGAQQDLATLVARLGIARTIADGDLLITLNEIHNEVRRVLVELRELAQGIHPSVLRDGGLVAAIEDRCSRLPIEVDVRVGDEAADRRFPVEIEAAAYFFVAEALSNVLKHSRAPSVSVSLLLDGGDLVVEVADDGRGFDRRVEGGSGLSGLADRLRALGGEMSLRTAPGRGTSVLARLPVPVPVETR